MKHIPSRDITGQCVGECRNLAYEGEEERQREISSHDYTGTGSRSVSWARNRSEQPGFFGGHV